MAHIDLTIDIETIPDQNPEALKSIAEKMEFKAPSSLGKNEAYAELIAAFGGNINDVYIEVKGN